MPTPVRASPLSAGASTSTYHEQGQHKVGAQRYGLRPVKGGIDPGAGGAPPEPQEHQVGASIGNRGLGISIICAAEDHGGGRRGAVRSCRCQSKADTPIPAQPPTVYHLRGAGVQSSLTEMWYEATGTRERQKSSSSMKALAPCLRGLSGVERGRAQREGALVRGRAAVVQPDLGVQPSVSGGTAAEACSG